MKKKEKNFLTILIFFTIFLWSITKIIPKESHDIFKISIDGTIYGTYSLQKEQTIHIGETNVCEVKNGEVHMISATCPDHLCIKQYPIDSKGGTIVCLPNKVVIEGGTTETTEVDAVN